MASCLEQYLSIFCIQQYFFLKLHYSPGKQTELIEF